MKDHIDIYALDISKLPNNVTISTMSATCSLGIDINLSNIWNYMELNKMYITTIKYKGEIKSLEKQKKKKRKKVVKSFQNQLTVEIRPDLENLPDNKISIKIFKNGSIQMSGVKSLLACNLALNKLIDAVSKEYGIINDGKIEDIKFISDITKIAVIRYKVDMINSNFNINYEVNRENLYNILLKKKIECRYEPSIHACVNIKFRPSDAPKNISIFVFQSGHIIITGAKTINSIAESYKYITELLEEHKPNIEKSKIANILFDSMNDELRELLKVGDDDDLAKIALIKTITSTI
jgi:TATA-box binding protein (TBP) (component of TFIID and TFIIIB)